MPARHPSDAPSPYSVLIATIFAILLLLFVYSVADVLLMVFVAALFSLYLGGIADFLQERLNISRGLGLLCAMIFTVLLATGIGYMVIPSVLKQTQELVGALPREIGGWTKGLQTLVARYPLLASVIHPDEVQRQLSGLVANASKLVPAVLNFLRGFIDLSGILVMGIYLASRPEVYREGIIALAPPVHRELVRDILLDLKRSLRAWIGGQMIAMFVLGVLTWIGLMFLKVPYALAFAVFTGSAVLVPFFGSLLSTLLPAILVVGQGGIVQALLVVLLGVVIHVIEGNIIHPIVMERRAHLPPVVSITSVLVMGELLGFIGLLVAVPVLATTMVIVRRIYIHRLLEGKGFRRFVRDAPTEIRLPEGVLRVDPAVVSIPAILEEAGAAPR
jgi:predicted PurR-regulated permease PerM